jgi:hypothetical protein
LRQGGSLVSATINGTKILSERPADEEQSGAG